MSATAGTSPEWSCPQRPSLGDARAFNIYQVGLEGAPTGLLAQPAANEPQVLYFYEIRSRLGCDVRGDWFPVEAYTDDNVFIIDDDGSIFVSVDGLSTNKVHETENLLREFADALYE